MTRRVRERVWRTRSGRGSAHLARADHPLCLAAYSVKNLERILAAWPHASDVRNFHAWLKAGRVVRKGQNGIRIVAPDQTDDGKIVSIKHTHVFDVTQSDALKQRAAA